jgi:Protein ENHANCED DISEASE RESISTANCE 2, C-terminal
MPPPGIFRSASNDTADDTCHEDVVNYDFAYAGNETSHSDERPGCTNTAFSTCPPALARRFWAEPDSNSFRVRGANYKEDRMKQNAGQSIGRLMAVDVVTVDESLYSGFSMHPTERIQLALKREREAKANGTESDMPAFIFVVNIVIPGPRTFCSTSFWQFLANPYICCCCVLFCQSLLSHGILFCRR